MSDFDDYTQDWFRRAKIVADGREQITWDWITEAIRFRKIVQRIEDRLPYHGESPVRDDHTETITLGGDEINEMRAALTPKGSGKGSSTHSLPTPSRGPFAGALERGAKALADWNECDEPLESHYIAVARVLAAAHDPDDADARDALAAKLFGPDWVSKQQNASAALRALQSALRGDR